MRYETERVKLMVRGILAGIAVAIWCSQAVAQMASTGAGGTMAGGTMSGSTTTSGTTASSSAIFGSAGSGSSGVTSTNTTGTSPIQKTDPFGPYYSNPMAAGYGPNVVLKPANAVNVASSDQAAKSTVTGKGTFGVAMFSTTPANSSSSSRGSSGSGSTTSIGTAGTGFTTIHLPRNPSYITTIDPRMARVPIVPMKMQAELSNVLTHSSSLASAKNLSVTVDDAEHIVIHGTVGSADDRQLAEALVRMTPGTATDFVTNDITVEPPGR